MKNILLYIGKSRRFPKIGWIHPCYFCETPTSNYFSSEYIDYIVEIYICNYCCDNTRKLDYIYDKIISNNTFKR